MIQRAERFDVVIAGASFAGLATARALSQAFGGEVRIAVLDRLSGQYEPGGDPRASAISASSRRMLQVLGIWPLVEDGAQDVTEVEITDSSLEAGIRPVLLTYSTALAGTDAETGMSIVPNDALMSALLEVTRSDPAIRLLSGSAVTGFKAEGPSVRALRDDGADVRGSLLVAADGRRSRLRQAAGIGTVGWSYPQSGIVTTVEHERPHNGRAVQHFLPAGPFAILPLKGNRSCITWSEERARAELIVGLDDASFLIEVDQRFGGKLGELRLSGPRRAWPLEMHLTRSYVGPRLALVGDAAHVVHPIAGQGLNLALRDIAALVEVVAEGARVGLDLGDAAQLERYERWRRFDATASAAAFDGLNRIFSNDWRLLRSAREAGLGVVNRLPQVKSWLVTEAAGLTGDIPRLLQGRAV